MSKSKRIAWTMLMVFMLSIALPFGPVATASADTIDSFVEEMQAVYPFIDEADKPAIQAARSSLNDLVDNPEDASWDSVVDALLTAEVIELYRGENEDDITARANAKTAMIQFAGAIMGDMYYSTDATTLAATLRYYKANYADDFNRLFDPLNEFAIDEFYQLLLDTRAQLPNVIQTNSAYIDALAFGPNTSAEPPEGQDPTPSLVNTMPKVMRDAMNLALAQPEHEVFRQRLTDIGWSEQTLIDQQAALGKLIDDAQSSAQVALAKAAVRSQSQVTYSDGNTIVNVPIANGDTIYIAPDSTATFSLKIMGEPATTLVDWNSSNPAIGLSDSGLGNILTAGSTADSTVVTAYRSTDSAGDVATDWLISFNVVVGEAPVVDKTVLTNAITAANTLMDSKTVGTDPGSVPQAAKDAYTTAITIATGVKDNTAATQTQVDDAVTALSTATTAFNAAIIPELVIKYGDVNGDNVVDNKDLVLVKRYFANVITAFSNPPAADVNGDQVIDNKDLVLVKRYFANVISSFPAQP